MELTFFKKKQLNDYLNMLSGGGFQVADAGVYGTRITQYPVKAEYDAGDETVMTDEEALDYLEVVVDNQMEAILNAARFVRVIRRRERDDLAEKYGAAMTERKGVFEGLQEAIRRGYAGPRRKASKSEEVGDDPRDMRRLLVEEEADEEGETDPGLLVVLRNEAKRRMREDKLYRDHGGRDKETATEILDDVLSKAYTAGRVEEQELHRD